MAWCGRKPQYHDILCRAPEEKLAVIISNTYGLFTVKGQVTDDNFSILAQHWMITAESINNDDDERNTVFAEVGSTDNMLGLLEEY
ncbi:MAG: hypothetical protein JXM70_08315 [Pirellulales bacterium]|nr:hypothetical protein [Pirellulales bacterium]